jgi:hypothetical protein
VKVSCLKDQLHGTDTVSIDGVDTVDKTACPDAALGLSAATLTTAGTLTATYTGTATPTGARVVVQGAYDNRSTYKMLKYWSQGTASITGRSFQFPLSGLTPGSYNVILRCDGSNASVVEPLTVNP